MINVELIDVEVLYRHSRRLEAGTVTFAKATSTRDPSIGVMKRWKD